MLDRTRLADEFNIQADEIIQEMRNATGNASINNPNKYIEDNIDRANKLLDMVIRESENGNFSARMAEVGSLLINSITIAYEKILSKKNSEASLHLKQRMLLLKERELDIKERLLNRPPSQNNFIVADREAVLRLLSGDNKQIENKTIDITVNENKEETNGD